MREGNQIAGDRPSAVVAAMSWLRRRRTLSLTLALLGLVAILFLDVLVPGYTVAAAYLVLVVFAAIALPQGTAIVIGSAGLPLTLTVMAIQGRLDGENLLLVGFGVLAGAGMLAFVSLSNSVENVYSEQRESLERGSFLVRLVDALLPLDDPLEVEETTVRLVMEQLAAARVAFFEVDEAGRLVERRGDARGDSSAPPDLGAFAAYLAEATDGRALALPAAVAIGAPAERQRAASDAADTGSWLAAPISEDGGLVAAVGAFGPVPRDWTQAEARLLDESVVRAWAEVRRARADAALRATESSLRDTLDSAVDGLYRLNVRTGRFDYISPSAAAITGVPLEELRKLDGPLAQTHIHPDDRAEAARAALDLERDGVAELDCRWAAGGSYRWYSGVMRLTRDEHGEPLFRTGTFRDVTAHKLREQNAAFIADLQDELAQVTSAQSVIDATGSRLSAYLGVALVSLTEIDSEREAGTVYVTWSDGRSAPPPTDVRFADFITDQVLADLCAGEIVVCRDVASDPRATAGAHSDIGVRSWVTVPFRRDGDLTFAFSVADRQPRDWRDDQIELLRDVAVRVLPRLERARAEEALVLEAARLRAIVEAAPVGLGIVAADGEVIMRNDVLRSIWVGEAPVHSIDEFEAYKAYWPETGEPLKSEDWPAAQALQHGESFAGVVVDIDRFDGTRGTIVLSTAPIQHEGVLLGAVTIVQDITRLRDAEKALRFLTEEVRTLHEAVVLDPAASGAELARIAVTQGGLLAGSDGSSIFLLGEDGSLRRIAGIGVPGDREIDDIVAQAIGRPVGDGAAASAGRGRGRRVTRQYRARRPADDPRRGLRGDGLHLRESAVTRRRPGPHRARVRRSGGPGDRERAAQGAHRGDGDRSEQTHAPRQGPARLRDAVAVRGESQGGGARRPAGRPPAGSGRPRGVAPADSRLSRRHAHHAARDAR